MQAFSSFPTMLYKAFSSGSLKVCKNLISIHLFVSFTLILPLWTVVLFFVEQDQPAHTCSLILLCTLHHSIINICLQNPFQSRLTHSLIHHFWDRPKFKEAAETTEMWLLKYFKIQIAWKTLWKKVKLLILSNFIVFYNVFLKPFSFIC